MEQTVKGSIEYDNTIILLCFDYSHIICWWKISTIWQGNGCGKKPMGEVSYPKCQVGLIDLLQLDNEVCV